jgi:hypothetical protein
MSNKLTECWTTDPQAKAIRIEPEGGRSWIMPYIHFIYAELITHEAEQTLKLAFSTHEIVLSGRGLCRLEATIHRMELASATALAERFRASVPQGQPFISKITVTAIDEIDSK